MSSTEHVEPERTHSLPSGAVLEEYGEGYFRIKQAEHTKVNYVWLAAEDAAVLLDALSE